MNILCASDSFKGSLSSERIAQLLKEVVDDVFVGAVTQGVLVADGGEGTMDTMIKELGGSYRQVLAEASGLPLVDEELRNPLKTTSYGTGMLIRDALDQGIRDIVIGIGGSATNDGGMGVMSALGVRYLDDSGKILKGCGQDLSDVKKIDLSHIHPAISETSFTVMCDVTNPLLGKNGATYTFGSQKGAAGGLGFALLAFLNAELKSGIETVLDLIHFDKKLKDVDLVITGEGRMDEQSSCGKVPSGVGKRCKKAGVPAVAVVGGLVDGYQDIYEAGICSIVTTINNVMGLEEAIERSEELYKDAAFRLLNAIKCGMTCDFH